MLRVFIFFVVIFCGMTGLSFADCGTYPNCCTNEYGVNQTCMDCGGMYNTYEAFGGNYLYNIDRCGHVSSSSGNESDFTCKKDSQNNPRYTRRIMDGNALDIYYACTCADDQYEYGFNNSGETICKYCPREKVDKCGWKADGANRGSFESCLDGYEIRDTGDGYECACYGNHYLYEDPTNGNNTICVSCPSASIDPGAQCGSGDFSCKLGYIRMKNGANGYKCVSCGYDSYAALLVSPYDGEYVQVEINGETGYDKLIYYDPDYCDNHGCSSDDNRYATLGENCTATFEQNDVDDHYYEKIGNYGASCNVVQHYRNNRATLDANYVNDEYVANGTWELVDNEFSMVAPGSYINDGNLCRPCTGNTYSYGGTYVVQCFNLPDSSTTAIQTETVPISSYSSTTVNVNTGFTCTQTGDFKSGNARCQSCPTVDVTVGGNTTTLTGVYDSTKTGIAACYIPKSADSDHTGFRYNNSHGNLKFFGSCYAKSNSSTGTIKFCVTGVECAQKLFKAVPTESVGNVNVNVNDLNKLCSNGWFDLPGGLNNYISELESVGCMQWYTDYGV